MLQGSFPVWRRAIPPQVVSVGLAAETDEARTITCNPQRRLVARASETDAAQAITVRKTVKVTTSHPRVVAATSGEATFSGSSGAWTRSITIPTHDVGDLLLVAVMAFPANVASASPTMTASAGWSELLEGYHDAASDQTFMVWGRVATGSDGLTISSALTGGAFMLALQAVVVVRDHGVATVTSDVFRTIENPTVAGGPESTAAVTASTHDPPSLDTGTSAPYLWLEIMAAFADAATAFQSSGYQPVTRSNSGVFSMSVASLGLTAQTEDPGVMTLASSGAGWASTFAAVHRFNPTETDAAQTITPRKSRSASVGVASETDAAQTIAVVQSGEIVEDVVFAEETDTAQTITARKTKLINDVALVTDDFNRADTNTPNNGDVGLGSDYDAPFWRIQSNRAARDGGNDDAIRLTDLGTLDHWAEIRVIGTPGVQNPNYNVVHARMDGTRTSLDPTNAVTGYIEPGGGRQATIAAWQGGSFSVLGGGATGLDISGTYTLRLMCDGGTAYLYLNGVLVHSQDISSLTGLGHYTGFAAQNGAPPIDDFRAGTLVLAETDAAQTITRVFRVAVAEADETDTAQAITTRKTVAVTHASETDEARTITRGAVAVEIGFASETDSAQAVTGRKTASIADASESDAAQGVASLKTIAVARASETDEARAVSAVRVYPIDFASETDEAQDVERGGVAVEVGHASETDEAQTITVLRAYALGFASETDEAREITRGAVSVEVTFASEADAAQAVTARKTASIDFATETDEAQAVTSLKTVAVTHAAETDAAQTVAVNPQRRFVGFAVETDEARGIDLNPIRRLVGLAAETDEPQDVDVDPQRRLIGPAIETDTANDITSPGTLGASVETDEAQPVTTRRTYALGQASETDAARTVTAVRFIAVGHATETDTAQSVDHSKARLLGLASETDEAQTVAQPGEIVVDVGHSTESDAAQAISAHKRAAVGTSAESEAAQAITARKSRLVAISTETDLARPLGRLKIVAVGHASESDLAQAINVVRSRVVAVLTALETDEAQPLTIHRAHRIGQALETDLAQTILPTGGELFLQAELELSLLIPGLELTIVPQPSIVLDIVANAVSFHVIADDLGLEILAGEIS